MKIKNILFLIIATFAFVACSDDTDPVLPQYKASELTHPANDTSYELEQVKDSEVLFTLDWKAYTQTDLLVGPVSFWVQIDTVGNNFEKAQTLRQVAGEVTEGEVSNYSESFTVGDVNKVLVNSLKLTPDSLANLEIRVVTHVGNGNALVASSASNVFQAKFVPYKALDTPALYIVGDGLVGWSNEAAAIGKDLQVFFGNTNIEVSLGKYTYTGFFKGGAGVKLITKAGDWDTAYGLGASGALEIKANDNIPTPATDGYYTFTVDLKALTYSFKPYAEGATATTYDQIGIIGDAAKGWGDTDDILMTKYAGHVWVATSVDLKPGGLKFRIISADGKGDWGTNWGADEATVQYPFGISDGGGNFPIAKAGKYYIAFNDLTKHFVIMEEGKLP